MKTKLQVATLVALALLVLVGFLGSTKSGAQLRTRTTYTAPASATFTLRAASGPLTGADTPIPLIECAWCVDVVIVLDVTTITTPDGDDEIDFYFQTTYDGGTTWTDLENVHFATADNGTPAKRIVRLGPPGPISSADKAADNTDGTLADDTKNAYPLGAFIRAKTAVTGATAPTYAYSAKVFVR